MVVIVYVYISLPFKVKLYGFSMAHRNLSVLAVIEDIGFFNP